MKTGTRANNVAPRSTDPAIQPRVCPADPASDRKMGTLGNEDWDSEWECDWGTG